MNLILTSNIRNIPKLSATLLAVVTLFFTSCEKKVFTHPEKKQKTEADYLRESMTETETMLNNLDEEEKTNRENKKNNENKNYRAKNLNFPPSNKSLIEKATKFKANKEYKKALKIFLKILDDEPKNISVLGVITELYLSLNDYFNSKKYAQKILDIDDKNMLALTLLADTYDRTDQINKAINIYLKIVSIKSNYLVLYNLAILYDKQGKLRKAFEFYKKSLRDKPSSDAYYALALISKKLKNNTDTILYLKKSIAIKKSNKVKRFLASEYLRQKKYKDAILLYQELSKASSSIYDYINLGNAYLKEKNYAKAEITYQKALKISPSSSDLLYNLAICYYKMKSPKKMQKIIKQYEGNSSSITKIRELKVYLTKISK